MLPKPQIRKSCSLRVSEELEVSVKNGYSTFPKAQGLEPRYQVVYGNIQDIR